MILELAAAFSAGASTSLGPCAAPRGLAVASFVDGPPRRKIAPLSAFVVGIVGAYAVLGYATSQLAHTIDIASWAYAILALVFIACGAFALFGAKSHDAACTPTIPSSTRHRSLGGMFLLGASSAAIVSPCCAPIVLAVAAYTSALGAPGYGSVLLAAFALGHALPTVLLGLGARSVTGLLRNPVLREATSVVGGTLFLILGIFYGCQI